MTTTEERVPVTVMLPRSLLDELNDRAREKHGTVESELESLVEKGLEADLSYRERFDRLSEMYRERLKREGKLDQTPEEILDELARIREQVANEMYPG